MPVPAQDIPFLKSQGWTDDEIANYNPPIQPRQPITGPQTVGRTLVAHGGGILGGGAGAIGGGALAGTMVEPGIGTIAGGIIGALAGGYAGQKGQQAIESPETYEQQQLLAQQAAEQHPNIAEGTDITAGALASGGMFSPTTAAKGIGGIIGKLTGRGAGALIAEQKGLIGQAAKAMASGSQEDINAIASRLGTVNKALPSALEQSKAAQQVLLQSALNPAISTGLSLAQGQGMPSASELGKQALGGALFAKSWLPHGRLGEPNPEVNNSELSNDGSQEPTSKPWVSPFTAVDDAGDYKIGNKQIQSLFKKKDSGFLQPVPKDADAITKAYINTANEKLAALPVDQMREMLHQKAMGEKANDIAGVNEPEAGLRSEEEPTGEETPITRALMGLEPRGEINDNTKIPTEDTSATKPVFTTEVLQKIIDKGATKPVSVQRIFPKLNLSIPEATEALRQADLLAELHENRPQGETQDATGIRENTGQPSETGQVAQRSQDRSGQNMVEQTPRSSQSVPQEVGGELQTEKKPVVNSPLSDYNRYQELDRQRVAMESKITDPEELMASPEHQAISRELEAIKNRNGGMPPPQFPENHVLMPIQLQSHILNGKATTGSILHGLANTPDHPLQELASGLLKASDAKSLQVKWNHDPSLDSSLAGAKRSHYDPVTDKVNIGTGSAGDARVVMEEAVHSLTSKKIPFFKGQGEEHYNRLNTYLKNGSNEHVKDLIRCYFETAKALGIHPELFKDTEMPLHPKGAAGNPDEAVSQIHGYGATTKYAMGNLDEFIAQAIKDPEFQRVLNGIKTTDNRIVWQTIVDAVRNLLGLDAKAGSMLERVLRTSGELVHQERPEGLTSIKDRVNAPPKEGEHVTPELKPFFGRAGRFFQNAIERARTVAPEVSDAYHRFYNARSEIFGKVYGNVKNVMNRTGFTTEDGKRLIEAQRQEELTGKPIATTFFKNNAQRQVWNEYKLRYKEQGEEAVKDKQPVYDYNQHQFRIRQLSDTSHPMMLNPKIGEILRANTDTEKVDQLKQDFLDNQKAHGVSLTDAQENLATELKAMQGTASNTGSGSMAHFNANRRAQGIPLPPSWQRDNFEQNLRAYASRNAGDRAHYKYIESNPSVMAQLGETHDAWGRPIPPTNKPVVAGNQFVKSLINESKGEVGPQGFYTERAGSSTATALFISSPALSAVHVPISNISGIVGLTRNPIETGRTLLAGLKGMYSGVATANKNGLVIPMARPVSDIWDSSLTTAEHFQAMASIVRRIASFNDIATKANLGYMQAAMEFLVPKRVAQANYGEGVGAKTSQQWLRKLDPDYTIGKQYSPNETQQLASRAVGYLHGTNDPRSMPEWMMRDSEISGFFSIAHWSVAQTDRFMRDVWTPATKGDLTPLVASMFGATLGGYIIKELREQISGKHSPIPSLQEIAASDRSYKGNAGPLAYNMISALQYAGFGGVFSQIAKWPFDVAYKNIPQAAAFPLDEEITDIGGTISNVASALANDPNINYVDLAKNVMAHVLTSDFRLAREGYNQLINNGMITGTLAEKKALSDKMGQLRRFEQVEGLPFNAQDASNANPYMNLEQKKFKMEQDPQKAMAMLPGLINNIVTTYHSNPDVMMSKLKALKENAYETFPSMEQMPLQMFKYIGYLQREEGPEMAQKELMDYMKHKVINEAKSSVVP